MAQNDIQGTVVDASGNPISGAIVELTKSYQSNPTTTESVKRTTTDANGNYIFTSHPDDPGTTQEYHVSCYDHDGTAYVNSENNPGVTADLSADAIPDSGVARYTLDSADTTTTTATDVWNGNNATVNGATTGVSGANQTYATNEAISFDGTDDNIDLPTAWESEIETQVFSIGFWFKPDSNAGIPHDYNNGRCSLRYEFIGANGWEWVIYDGTTNYNVTTGITTTGTWNHIIATLNSSGVLEVYVNGSSVGTASGVSVETAGQAYLAQLQQGTDHFSGDIDDPRLYSKAVSATEASNWHNTGSI